MSGTGIYTNKLDWNKSACVNRRLEEGYLFFVAVNHICCDLATVLLISVLKELARKLESLIKFIK